VRELAVVRWAPGALTHPWEGGKEGVLRGVERGCGVEIAGEQELVAGNSKKKEFGWGCLQIVGKGVAAGGR